MFLTSRPLMRKVTSIHEQDSTETVLEHRGEAEASPETKNCIGRGIEMATHWPHWPFPRPAQHHAERSLKPSVPSVGKESPRGTTSYPGVVGHFVGAPTLVLSHGDGRRTNGTQPLGIWHDGEEGKGFQQSANGSQQTKVIPGVPE